MEANTYLIHDFRDRSINILVNGGRFQDCELRSRSMLFPNHFSPHRVLFAMIFCSIGCTDSSDSVLGVPQKNVIRIDHLLQPEIYDRAFSEASSSREREIIRSSQRLEGKQKTPAVAPETIQTMQEVMFESATPEIRAVVAAGLGNACNVTSVPMLIDAMEDDALVTRQVAAQAVGKIMGWRQGFDPEDPAETRAESVEQFRERWMLFEESNLYKVATDPDARKRAGAIAAKRAKFLRRKERELGSERNVLQNESPKPKKRLPPQQPPTAEQLLQQFELN